MSEATGVSEAGGVKVEAAPTSGGVGLVALVGTMLATVVLVLGGLGGGIYWLVKTGRMPIGAAVQAAPVESKKQDDPKKEVVLLEPLLVNLSDQGGAGYLRVVMALEVELPVVKDAKPKEEKPPEKGKTAVNEMEVKMRDVALTVLGRETSEHLLAPEGKEQLKKELQTAIADHLHDVKVTNVMFTEFLVQR